MKSVLCFMLVTIGVLDAYKVLVYNPKFGSKSHVTFMGKIADILVEAGHDVTVYLPVINKDLATNGTKLAQKVIVYQTDDAGFSVTGEEFQYFIWLTKINGYYSIKDSSVEQINDKTLINTLKFENFDIAIGEPLDMCYYGILRAIGLKNYITVTSSGVLDNIMSYLGIPATPSFVPNLITTFGIPQTSYQKALNMVQVYLLQKGFHDFLSEKSIEVMKKRFPGFDPDDEIAKSALYFVNVDEHVDFPRPISHKIIHIGGIQRAQGRPLEKKFFDIMEKSNKGVILISFGTAALSYVMPQEMKTTLLETFKKFSDITFLWKYEKDEHKIAEGIPNVITSPWFPQNDLLDHPKLLAFISHGGLNSAQEGSSKGVPMIMIPILYDQFRNSEMLAYRKMAITLKRDHLSVESLSHAINSILQDDSYRENAKRIASIIAAKPMSAEERLVKYTEFAAKFGPDLNLDMEGRHLNFVEFYCLDIIIPVVLMIVLVLWVMYRVVGYILRRFLSLFRGEKKKHE